jgi:hypothetical protein
LREKRSGHFDGMSRRSSSVRGTYPRVFQVLHTKLVYSSPLTGQRLCEDQVYHSAIMCSLRRPHHHLLTASPSISMLHLRLLLPPLLRQR